METQTAELKGHRYLGLLGSAVWNSPSGCLLCDWGIPTELDLPLKNLQRPRNNMLGRHELASSGEDDLKTHMHQHDYTL